MHVLVLGGTGTVGRPLVAQLRERGASLRVASREPSGPHGALFRWDEPTTWRAAVDGITAAFVMTPPGVARVDERMAALAPVLAAARLDRVVHLSGFGVEHTTSPMRRAELALDRAGLAVTHLRPNYFMQNFAVGALVEGLRTRSEIAAPAGSSAISFVDARDIADVACEALCRDVGPALTLTGPAALSHGELAATLARVLDRPIAYRAETADEARRSLAAAGLAEDRIEARIGFLALAQRGALADVTEDLPRVLGRAAHTWERFALDHASTWMSAPSVRSPS